MSFAPAPHDETASYRVFSAWFSPALLLTLTVASYVTTIFFERLDLMPLLIVLDYIPGLIGRYEFLAVGGRISQASFLATVVSGLVLGPAFILFNFFWYWKLVLSPKKHRGIHWKTFLIVGYGLAVIAGLSWIVFFSVPENFDPNRAGFAAILFWPFFPFIGSGVVCLAEFILFSALIAFLKLVYPRGVENG